VALSRFVRVTKAGWKLRVGPRRELVGVVEPVLPPDCDADPPEGAEGAEGAGAVPGRSVVVTTGGATGLGAGVAGARGVVMRGGVVTVTGGVLTVTGGGAGAGGSAVVTGSGGGGGTGGRAVVTGSGGGGGTAVVIGNDGVVTVTPGTGGRSRASACAATKPARAATRPQRLQKRDIPKLQRTTLANGCGRAS
jgi:hypothetical protein